MNISIFFQFQIPAQNTCVHVPLKYLQDVGVLKDEIPKKLTGCDVSSDHSMNVPAPTSSPSPTRMMPFSQLAQNGLNSVQDIGLWDAVAMEAQPLHFRITDFEFSQPPTTISYE